MSDRPGASNRKPKGGTRRGRTPRRRASGDQAADAITEAAQPDPSGAAEAVGDAVRPPTFRTKTRAPSTSERHLRPEDLPPAGDSTQG
jgi:hypothetical protein